MAKAEKGMSKGFLALAVIGGIVAMKILRNRKEASRGYCQKMGEKLGEKIDKGLEGLACKADELLHHKP